MATKLYSDDVYSLRINDPEAAINKTIAALDYDDGDMVIRFSDGTWLCVTAECDGYGEDVEAYFGFTKYNPCHRAMHRARVIDTEEHDRVSEALNALWEEQERAEYERLKARFERKGDE